MPKKLKVDKALCISCGTCTGAYAQNFKMGEDGKSEFYGEPMEDGAAEAAKAACPVQAIQDDAGE